MYTVAGFAQLSLHTNRHLSVSTSAHIIRTFPRNSGLEIRIFAPFHLALPLKMGPGAWGRGIRTGHDHDQLAPNLKTQKLVDLANHPPFNPAIVALGPRLVAGGLV